MCHGPLACGDGQSLAFAHDSATNRAGRRRAPPDSDAGRRRRVPAPSRQRSRRRCPRPAHRMPPLRAQPLRRLRAGTTARRGATVDTSGSTHRTPGSHGSRHDWKSPGDLRAERRRRASVSSPTISRCASVRLEKHLKRAEQCFVILDRIQAGDVEHTPRRTFRPVRRNKRGTIDAERNRARGPAVGGSETSLILRAHREPGREPGCGVHRQSLTHPQLRAVPDVGERDEFTAVAGDHRWDASSASLQRL